MAQSQNVNLGNMGQMANMGNPQANMQGMMGQPMQATMSNQGNPMAPQFNPQLGRPMQVSQLPMNGQAAQQGMQNANFMNNQNQPGMQQNPQQQGNNGGGLSMNENQKINQLAQRMMQQATPEQKAAINAKFQLLPPAQQAQLRQRQGDPIAAHFRNMAQQLWIKQMGGMRQNQAPQNGMQNNMMGQGVPMMQQGRPQQQVGQQDGGADVSQFMLQQQEALASANNGALVVPVSQNTAMNQNMNGMQIGMQPGQMGGNMSNAAQMQNIIQQQRQNGGMTPQMQAAARLQAAQMRNQPQNGQGNQPGQMTPQQMKMSTSASPMPQMRQPVMQPGQQQPGQTPQQQRPTPTPTPQVPQQQNNQPNQNLVQAMQLAAQMAANGQPQPIRRQLPPDLPPNLAQTLRHFLQVASDEHYNVAIEQIRKAQAGNQMNNAGNGNMMNNNQMMQPNNGMQQNPGMPNGAQNQAQANMMRAQQQAAQQQRAAEMQARIAAQNQLRQNGQAPGGMNIPPEIMQQMDQMNFPRSILAANGVTMVPQHVVNFLQLKEWVLNNQALAGALNIGLLVKFQVEMWKRRHTQMNANNQQQMNGQMFNNGQPGSAGGAPGPAPTAPMVPPGGMNNMGQQPQQQPQNMMTAAIAQQMQSIQVAPQEIATARARAMFPPHMSDDEVRSKLLNLKRQNLMQKIQQQRQALNMQQQAAMANNQMNNQQRMQQGQMPQPPQRGPMPGQQPPQTGMVTPGGTNNTNVNQQKQQPTPRQNQQQPANNNNNLKTPQQAAKNLKRPAPEEIIEIQDNVSTSAPPQAPQMQTSKSQQSRNNNTGASPDANMQALHQRFGQILQEAKAKHQPRQQQPPLNEQERQQLVAKVNEAKPILQRTEWAIRLFFQGSRDEEKTKAFLARYWALAEAVNLKEAIVLGGATMRANEFENTIALIRTLVTGMMNKGIAARGQNAGANGQQQGNAANAGQLENAPTPSQAQLNAANLDQHNQQIRQAAAQGHRRSSSKAQQVPSAPTAGPGQNPFNFNSPQGVPKYGEGAGNLTSDKLNLPRKKARKDGQPPSGQSTPAQTGMAASPQISKGQSPQIKKQPAPEQQMPQPPKNPCQDTGCDYNKKGFKTPEELAAHVQQMHTPPADPLKYAIEAVATSVGLNGNGSVKVEQDVKPNQAGAAKSAGGVQVKAGATPPAGTTPLNKIPMKGSPAMDRLKTPSQLSNKPPAPTSAAAPTANDKNAKQGDTSAAGKEELLGMDVDPWKDATLGQSDLLEWLKPYDTFTGDWGNDRTLRSPQLTPATTPDTSITDKTVSTRDSEVLDSDALTMTLAMPPFLDSDLNWKGTGDIPGWEPGIMDLELASDGIVGLQLDAGTMGLGMGEDINDWEAMFGGDSGAVPGWEQDATMMF
jgi:hypothetical protein